MGPMVKRRAVALALALLCLMPVGPVALAQSAGPTVGGVPAPARSKPAPGLGLSAPSAIRPPAATPAPFDRRLAPEGLPSTGPDMASGYVFRVAGCGDRILVQTANGYSVVQVLSATDVNVSDLLQGRLESLGRGQAVNNSTSKTMEVFVEESMLQKSAIDNRIQRFCRKQ
jgi:hypothetical protein